MSRLRYLSERLFTNGTGLLFMDCEDAEIHSALLAEEVTLLACFPPQKVLLLSTFVTNSLCHVASSFVIHLVPKH